MNQRLLIIPALGLVLSACGPSPEAVCDHALTLAKGEVGDKAAEAALGTRDDCVKSETRRKEMQGLLKYRENNACLMDAKTWADATKCRK
jgi:hypothetical protein